MKKKIVNITISIISIFITLLLLEFFFRLYYGKVSGKVIPLSLKIHKKVKNQNLKYTLIPNSSVFQDNVEYKINSFGIRDYPDHTNELNSEKFKIAAVGDSFTFGLGVNLKDTWPKQLEQMLYSKYGKGFKVYNFGVMGYDLTQNIENIREKVLGLKPNLIIVGYCINDVGIFSREYTEINYFKGYRKFLKTGIPFIDRILDTSKLYQFIKTRLYMKKTKKSFKKIEKPKDARLALRRGYHNYLEELYNNEKVVKKLNEKFALLGEISRINKIPIVIALFPELKDFANYRFFHAHEIIKEACNRYNLYFIDLWSCVNKYKEEELRLNAINLHPNPFGYKLFSQCILKYLSETGLLTNQSDTLNK